VGVGPFAGLAGCQLTTEDHARIPPKLLAKIRRAGFAAEEPEDLVQETLLLAQRALNKGGFQGQSDLDTWIIGIAKNQCLKQWRTHGTAKRSGHEVALDQTRDDNGPATIQPVDHQSGPEQQAQDRQLLDRALRAMADLPAKIRAPLVLLVRGHSYQQIASLLRISPNLVTSRLGQARAKLRQAVPRLPRGSPR